MNSGELIYQRGKFIIFKAGNNVVVYNTSKVFEEGHSHLRSIKSAKDAIYFVEGKKIPKSSRNYYLVTLQRISDDVGYVDKIQELIDVRTQKGKKQQYFNPNKK